MCGREPRCSRCAELDVVQFIPTKSAMAADTDTQEAMRSVMEKIPGISYLKSQQDECLVGFLNGNYVVALFPTETVL